MVVKKADRAGTLHPLSFRVTADLKRDLDDAASAKGRSVTAEIQSRLEMSFVWERAFKDVDSFEKKAREQAAALVAEAERHARIIARKHPLTGFVDETTEKPEHAPVTAEDVRRIIQEVLDAREAAKPRKRA